MRFDLVSTSKTAVTHANYAIEIEIEAVIVAGFTGRNQEKVQAHIDELVQLGVTPPASVPTFYLVPPQGLVQTPEIVTTHPNTSGEAEIALLVDGEDIYVTLASDHTDRTAEILDVGLSKLACPKILATVVWPLVDVLNHWDKLRLQSWVHDGSHGQLYQTGNAQELLPCRSILAQIPFKQQPKRFVILLGTLPVIGEIRGGSRFLAELHDPIKHQTITLEYQIRHLGNVLEFG